MRISKHSAVGFTLIEIVIALTILGLVLVAVVKMVAEGTASLVSFRERVLADIVAENRMIEDSLADVAPPIGTSEGVEELAGQRWAWVRRTTPTADKALVRLEIDVLGSRSSAVVATLTAFRLGESR